MFDTVTEQQIPLTLYTDSYVVRGTLRTRQRRVTDILNQGQHPYVILEEVTLDEFGSHESVTRAPYAHVNLDAVLFAVALTRVEPAPEFRMTKVTEQALVSIPPFRVVGRIHLSPSEKIVDALEQLESRFIPVTEATFWSEELHEPRTQAPMVAVNTSRAQILAPFEVHDPWADIRPTGGETA